MKSFALKLRKCGRKTQTESIDCLKYFSINRFRKSFRIQTLLNTVYANPHDIGEYGTLHTEVRYTLYLCHHTGTISLNFLISDLIRCSPLVKKCDVPDAHGHIYNHQLRSADLSARALDGRLPDWSIQDFSPHFLMSYLKKYSGITAEMS